MELLRSFNASKNELGQPDQDSRFTVYSCGLEQFLAAYGIVCSDLFHWTPVFCKKGALS